MRRFANNLFLYGLIMFFLLVTAKVALADPPLKTTSTSLFSDVYQGDGNVLFINYLANRGFFKGFPDGTFHPTSGLTRAEAATLLCRVVGISARIAPSHFYDVDAEHWAAGSIASTEEVGLLNGYPDGTFRPDAKLTRAEGIALFLRLSKQPNTGTVLPSLGDINPTHWAAHPAAIALASGMVGLSADKKHFFPDAPFTRGDLARMLGILLTKEPALAQTNLVNKLNVIKGSVTVTRAGSQVPTEIKENIEVNPEDKIVTGAKCVAELIFPDGSGLRLEEETELSVKEARGKLYIKSDGASGTAVDWLNLDLKKGRMFGTLATRYEVAGVERKAEAKKIGNIGLNSYPLIASLNGWDIIADNGNSNDQSTPWWMNSQTKRVRVKVDMPWGVAAIRGTFWENIVHSDGKSETTVLTGNAEVTAAGQTVSLEAGQSTRVTGPVAPPTKPSSMTVQELQEWVQVESWLHDRAQDIQNNQEAETPPVPPTVNTLVVQQPQPPVVQQPQPPVVQQPLNTLITGKIDEAKTEIGTSNGGGSGGGGGDTNSPLGYPVTLVQGKTLVFQGGINISFPPSLIIPQGASVTLKEKEVVDLPSNQTLEKAGKIIDFIFEGIIISQPIQISLPINSNVDTRKIAIYYYDSSKKKWKYQPSSKIIDGNMVQASVSHFSTYGVLLDNLAPTFDIKYDISTIQTGKQVEISVTPSEPLKDLPTVQVEVNGTITDIPVSYNEAIGAYVGLYQTTVNQTGHGTISVSGIDLAGNTGSGTANFIIEDTTPPVFNIVPADGEKIKAGEQIAIRITPSEALQRLPIVLLELNGINTNIPVYYNEATGVYVGLYQTTISQTGQATIIVSGTDLTGNTGNSTSTFIIDKTFDTGFQLWATTDASTYEFGQTVTLSGIVTLDGMPMKGVCVAIQWDFKDGPVCVDQIMTDQDGKFTVKYVITNEETARGNYTIYLSAEGVIKNIIFLVE